MIRSEAMSCWAKTVCHVAGSLSIGVQCNLEALFLDCASNHHQQGLTVLAAQGSIPQGKLNLLSAAVHRQISCVSCFCGQKSRVPV
jgi:hypothetical protein